MSNKLKSVWHHVHIDYSLVYLNRNHVFSVRFSPTLTYLCKQSIFFSNSYYIHYSSSRKCSHYELSTFKILIPAIFDFDFNYRRLTLMFISTENAYYWGIRTWHFSKYTWLHSIVTFVKMYIPGSSGSSNLAFCLFPKLFFNHV